MNQLRTLLRQKLFLCVILAAVPAVYAGTIYVDASAPPGGNGGSWATAYRFLQDALAVADDRIEMAPGTYQPDRDEAHPSGTGDRQATFNLPSGVRVGARDPVYYGQEPTVILSGDLAGNDAPDFVNYGDNSYHVVDLSATGDGTQLSGVMIRGGSANGSYPHDRGAGIYMHDDSVLSQPAISSCWVQDNHAVYGGGVFCSNGALVLSSCWLLNNKADQFGGAMEAYQSTCSYSWCYFKYNEAGASGGGLLSQNTDALLTDCYFIENVSPVGAGLKSSGTGRVELDDCRFENNQAEQGGGIHNSSCELVLNDSSFVGNTARGAAATATTDAEAGAGGGLYNDTGKISISTCTFTSNEAYGGDGIDGPDHDRGAIGQGGGLCNNSGEIHITVTTFGENTARGGDSYEALQEDFSGVGGGVYNGSGPCSIEYCNFDHNTAVGGDDAAYGSASSAAGGGLCNDTGPITVTGSAFSANQSVGGACSGNSGGGGRGGGLASTNGEVSISKSVFHSNGAKTTLSWFDAFGDPSYGGAVYQTEGTLTLSDCDFLFNRTKGGCPGEAGGGAVASLAGELTMHGCACFGNVSEGGAGCGNGDLDGAPAYGGAVHHTGTVLDLSACTFSDNVVRGPRTIMDADSVYGGSVFGNCQTVSVSHSAFSGNRAEAEYNSSGGGAVCFGGAAYFAATNVAIEHTFFWNNSVTGGTGDPDPGNGYGGGLYLLGGTTAIETSTFAQNEARPGEDPGGYPAEGRGGGIYAEGSAVSLENCILWENSDSGGLDESAQVDGGSPGVDYCCVQGWTGSWGGTGNSGTDPLLADADAGDLHLRSQGGRWDPQALTWVTDNVTSSCIDAGNPAASVGAEPFPNGMRINLGAHAGTGAGSKSWLGAVCAGPVTGDINQDCQVDLLDLALLGNHWLQDNFLP